MSHGGSYFARLVDLILCVSPSLPRWYDAEEADPSRRPYDRPSAPRGAPPTSDHVLMYPIQQSETSGTSLPASNFAVERPVGPHVSQVPADSGRPRPSYSWPPPSSPADPTTPPQGARASLPWSPSGGTYHEPNPTTEHESYYPRPQEHPSASPNMHQRELYYSHQYGRTGASGWTLRTPNSPAGSQRRHSSAQPPGSLSHTQTQNQTSYASPYMDHRRGDYDHGAAPRGA